MSTSLIVIVVALGLGAFLLFFNRDRARRVGGGPTRDTRGENATTTRIKTAKSSRPEPARSAKYNPWDARAPVPERLSSSDFMEVMREIAQGRKIRAIKMVREKTGMGLKEAKEYVEQIEASEN